MDKPIFDAETRQVLQTAEWLTRHRGARDPGTIFGKAMGGQVEFRDHTPYSAGDDFRHIDWSLVARLNELHIKRFGGSALIDVHLILDQSGSMQQGEPKKYRTARRLMAAAAIGLMRNTERLLTSALQSRLTEIVPSLTSPFSSETILNALEQLPPPLSRIDVVPLWHRWSETKRRSMNVVFSDFADPQLEPATLLRHLGRGSTLALVAIVSKGDLEPLDADILEIIGAEGEGVLVAQDGQLVTTNYRRLITEHMQQMQSYCAGRGVPFVMIPNEIQFAEQMRRMFQRGVE